MTDQQTLDDCICRNPNLPKEVLQKALELFTKIGIPNSDFGIQHADYEVIVFGGTNRMVARRDEDNQSLWTFSIDRSLCLKIRVAAWDELPEEEKRLETPS